MKILLLSTLLVSSALPLLAADNASVTGKWKIHMNVEGNESDTVCILKQTEDAVSGTCFSSEMKEVQAVGKVDGTKVSWWYDSVYNGDIDGKFSGTVHVDPYGVDGDFTTTADK